MEDGFNPYELLNLKHTFESTDSDIKKAYRKCALLKHPDKNPDADPEDFLAIQRAYDVLCDKDAKQALDNFLRARVAREARLSAQSLKRRKMREELEHREQESQAQATAESQLKNKLKIELDRLRAKLNSRASASQASQDLSQKKRTDFGGVLRMVKLKWGPQCDLEEKEIRALFAAVGPIKCVALKKSKRKGSGALLEMGSREDAQAVVRHVEVHEGLGLDSFSAKLMAGNEKQPLETDFASIPRFTDSLLEPKGRTIDLKSMEDNILGKLKRKSAAKDGM